MPRKKASKSEEKLDKRQKLVRQDIFGFLNSQGGNKTWTWKQIASGAALKGNISSNKIITILEELVEDGKLESVDRGKYKLPASQKTGGGIGSGLSGTIDITREGFGFVALDGRDEEVFIGASSVNRSMPGDKVSLRIIRPKRGMQKAEGEVIQILEHARKQFVGTMEMKGEFGILIPDNPRIPYDFLIQKDQLNGAKTGDKVLVSIIAWSHNTPEAKVDRVLGKTGENEAEMHAILYEFGFDPAFPAEVEAEAESIPREISADEIKKRRDLRGVMTFTIDPADAKDFDDALSFKELENGNYEIGIHIADVSHYVKPGTKMDDEAWHRATSVYLVDRTVPMLPEALSNFLCSLRPNEDKLTFSAMFEMTADGKIVNDWFGKTVIHSQKRFSYEEAQEAITSGSGEYGRVLQILNKLAHILRVDRFKHGSILIEEDEVKFTLDEKGKPTGLYRKVRVDSHKLIEDFMLLANKKVTEHVAKMRKDPPLPFVYRIHDRPNEEKLSDLKDFVRNFGYSIDMTNPQTIVHSLNKLMMDVEGKPEQHVVNRISIRTMSKAIYSTTNIGHYGLGFKFYTHFTSPIRRYPDVMVHRLLFDYLHKDYKANPDKLERSCKQSSMMEKKAAEAERASTKYKQVEYLSDKVGMEFDGLVSGVTSWGIYVEMIDNKCEGMVRLSEIEGDFYEHDEKNYCVRGRRTGHEIHLGDKVRVKVASANLDKRAVDLLLTGHEKRAFSGNKGLGSEDVKSWKPEKAKTKDKNKGKKGGLDKKGKSFKAKNR